MAGRKKILDKDASRLEEYGLENGGSITVVRQMGLEERLALVIHVVIAPPLPQPPRPLSLSRAQQISLEERRVRVVGRQEGKEWRQGGAKKGRARQVADVCLLCVCVCVAQRKEAEDLRLLAKGVVNDEVRGLLSVLILVLSEGVDTEC